MSQTKQKLKLYIIIISSSTMSSHIMNRKRSTVWHHFTALENNKAKCNICSEQKSFNGGSTGNLLRHIKTKHPLVPLERSIQVNNEVVSAKVS